MANRLYIDKYTGKIERTDVYLVKLTMKDGTVYENIEPRRLFPITNVNMYITLLNDDEKEVAFIRDLNEIDDESRKALEESFSEYYMIPKITALLSVSDKNGILSWTVDTDRGMLSFRIRNRHSDIKNLYGTQRIIIRDSNDNRYEIRDMTKMDKQSSKLLFQFI